MGRWLLLLAVAALPIAIFAVRNARDDDAATGEPTTTAPGENLYALYVLPLSGGAPRPVHDPRRNRYLTFDPAWSPEGDRLAVTEIDCHNCAPEVRLVALRESGAPRTKLASGSQPTFSPDGRTVAYVPADGGLAVIGTDGSGRRTLFDDTAGSINRPRFSPDGKLIAFMRQDRRARWHVWTARADGSRPRQLTTGAQPEADPAWTADGKSIAFALQSKSGLWHLFLVPRAGGKVRRLTGGDTSDSHPSFAPDGKSVVFVRQDGSRFFLVRQTLPNGPARPLRTAPLRDAAEPAVAPDGEEVAFVARR